MKKTFQFVNLETWEIVNVSAESKPLAMSQFKLQKNLTKIGKEWEIKEKNKVIKNYSSLSFSQFESKEFYNRK